MSSARPLAGLEVCVRAEELLFPQKIERLKSELHLLDAEGKSPNKHVFFLDTRREGKASIAVGRRLLLWCLVAGCFKEYGVFFLLLSLKKDVNSGARADLSSAAPCCQLVKLRVRKVAKH